VLFGHSTLLSAFFWFIANFTQENNYILNNLAAQSRQEQHPVPVQRAEQTKHYLFAFTCENGTRLLYALPGGGRTTLHV
jgi:hypothetical protein